jgi:hypothetical protein
LPRGGSRVGGSVVATKGSRRRTAARAIACAIVLLQPFAAAGAHAASLGGAYFVDDAEIPKINVCESEQWGSFAGNRDRVFVVNPACTVNLGRPVEIGATFVRGRQDGEWATLQAATAKTVLTPIEPGRLGVGLSGAVVYDWNARALNSVVVNVPLSCEPVQDLRLNVNVGWLYDASLSRHFLTTGGGFAWGFTKQWSLLGEVFAVVGQEQANPRVQAGLRYTPIDAVDIDVLYGHNIQGERAHWITLGLNFRIGDDR